MQERQTQVLALPARAEGRGRDTEGILEKEKKKEDVPPEGSPALTAAEIHDIPRNSRRFGVVSGDTDPCQDLRGARGVGKGNAALV